MRDTHPLIAREGWLHVSMAVLVAASVAPYAPLWSLPLWVVALIVLQFFRDPHRQITQGEGLVVSPADGRVIAVGPAEDLLLKRKALRVSVFMNIFNVHSNRVPESGEIIASSYREGSFVNAALDKASDENEANALAIKTAQGAITFVQIAGLIARRISCYVKDGDKVQRGQRYGFIRFGSRVDVYLPEDVKLKVSMGDTVSAGVSVLAKMPEAQDHKG